MNHSSDQPSQVGPDETEGAKSPVAPTAHPLTWRGDLINVARGFCMGAADTVPGVSGGTVALILGHYRRLVTAISYFDSTLLSLVAQWDLKAASKRIDLRFLTALGIGILCGAASLLNTMHWLLDEHPSETRAVFFGLMVASVWIVKEYVQHWTPLRFVLALLGAAAAVGIALLPASTASLTLPFLFISASLAICAMILPGISGALVLLLFGVYQPVSGMIKEAFRGNITVESMTQIIVFGSGCAFGLLAFSRGLRWLLEHRQESTMAVLLGLMIGSLGKLWPLQMPTAETSQLEAKMRVMQYVSPADYEGSLTWLFVLGCVALVATLVMEGIAKKAAIQ